MTSLNECREAIQPYRPFLNEATRLKLAQAEMRGISISLPPERERYEIVAKLEKKFFHHGEAVANRIEPAWRWAMVCCPTL